MRFELTKWKTGNYIAKTVGGEEVVRITEREVCKDNRFCNVTLTRDNLFTRTIIYQHDINDGLTPIVDVKNLKLKLKLK